MKAITLFAALVLAASFVGCGPEGRQVRKETGEAVDATVDYAKVQKEKAAVELNRQLSELEAALAALGRKADEKGAEAKAKYQEMKPQLDAKIAETKKNLAALGQQTGEAWEKLKVDLGEAMGELQKGVKNAADRLKD